MSSDMMRDDRLVRGVVEGRQQDRAEEGQRGGEREQLEEMPDPEREPVLTSAVIRMCSPRRSASTVPSMASHRNSSEASSSDQISGWWNA